MKITPAKIEAFVARPDVEIILVYGTDAGRVADIARSLLDKNGSVVTFDSDEIVKDPGRLLAAAAAQSLFAPRMSVRVREAGDKASKAVKELLEQGETNRVVIEAGDLPTRSSLRKLVEAAPNAAAIGCAAPEARELGELARAEFAAARKRLLQDAEALLAARLPRDTRAARNEIEKLLLYLGDAPTCSAEAVAAIVGDAAEEEMNEPALAAADGDISGVVRSLRRLSADGESAIGLLRIAQIHFRRLLAVRAEHESGLPIETAVANLRPPVFFKTKRRVETQARIWGTPQIERALGLLVEAETRCKSTGYDPETILAHALFVIANNAAAAKTRSAGPRPAARSARPS